MSYVPAQHLMQSAFGELVTAKLTPELQANAIYGLGVKMRSFDFGSASVSAENSMFTLSSGTTPGSGMNLFSARALVYRAGMGSLARFTMAFETGGIAGTRYRGGLLNATDELALGYNGADFSILYRHDGAHEIQDLQVTTPAAGAENATITIAGTPYTVPLTAGTVQHNATEIQDSLNAQVSVWNFQQVDDTVVCRSFNAGAFSGFTFSSGTAVAAFTQVKAGQLSTSEWTAMADWNGVDVSSWFNPDLGNVYQISYQWLGFGNIYFWIEDPELGTFTLVHTLKFPSSSLTPSLFNPTFRIGFAGSNDATSSDIIMRGSSFALFTEGDKVFTEEARASSNLKAGVASGTLTNIMTIKNSEVLSTKVNLNPIIPLSFSIETDSTKSVDFKLIKNATIGGEQNYQYVEAGNSIALIDTAGTTVTGGKEFADDVLESKGHDRVSIMSNTIELLPNETLTLAAIITSGAASEIGGSISWQEDI